VHGLRLVFASRSASPETLSDDIERHGIEYLQIWGVTETGPIACVSRPRRRHRGLDRAGVLETKEWTGRTGSASVSSRPVVRG
jgi:hypothetical protein